MQKAKTKTSNVRQWFLDRNIDPDLALAAGVRYDPERNAILYPRIRMDGSHAGWKVRHLDDKRVYNDRAGISIKDCQPFNAAIADFESKTLAICEGETDALSLATNLNMFEALLGARVVAVPGANAFPNEWASLFSYYDDVYLFPDPDPSGEQLVNKVCGLMARTKVVRLNPEYGDLNDHICNQFGFLFDAIKQAAPVPVATQLRRTNYEFNRTHDLPNSLLIDVVARDTKLKLVGSEYYGKCPLHDDSTPSFSIDPKKGVFWCHGCKKGGDIISYLIERDGLSFKEAMSAAESLR